MEVKCLGRGRCLENIGCLSLPVIQQVFSEFLLTSDTGLGGEGAGNTQAKSQLPGAHSPVVKMGAKQSVTQT